MQLVNKMSITDVIKSSLKYPQRDLKNTIIFAGFLFLFSLITSMGSYFTLPKLNLALIENSENFLDLFSLHASFNSFDWTIIIICIIAAFVVYLFVQGYIYRIYKGGSEVPEFDNLKTMPVDGLKLIAVSILYDILPAIVIFLGAYIVAFDISGNGFYLILIGGILLFIVDIFIKPFAIANMAKVGEFKGALDLNAIIDRIVSLGILPYLATVIFVFLINAIILAAFSTLSACAMAIAISPIPYIETLLMVIVGMIYAVVSSYLDLFSNKVYQLLYS